MTWNRNTAYNRVNSTWNSINSLATTNLSCSSWQIVQKTTSSRTCITWWNLSTETDPVWLASSWSYVLKSETWNRNTAYNRVNTNSWQISGWNIYAKTWYFSGLIVAWDIDLWGDITANAFYYDSDIRLKKNIVQIPNALDKILSLNWYYFNWKSDNSKSVWVIAQEIEKVFPELVKTDVNGMKSVEYGNLVAPLIEAIKELNDKVELQNKKILELEKNCNR